MLKNIAMMREDIRKSAHELWKKVDSLEEIDAIQDGVYMSMKEYKLLDELERFLKIEKEKEKENEK
ncbi:hypothetical protein COL70_08560 [Bacillus pseudomycoides]|uniref:hypothetical protein n=1 Tax=Bacillus pseudomycoides TaxID=64104 RepID=UPI000BF80BC0|nr:hypothetical protein [Bacillus pseudomycoides]PFZ93662.1 hypothetical protein COL70_08560 [Bacillus pseudomycoides]